MTFKAPHRLRAKALSHLPHKWGSAINLYLPVYGEGDRAEGVVVGAFASTNSVEQNKC